MSLTVEVVDVDAASCQSRGVWRSDYLSAHHHESYGIRRFQVTDPNGVVINVLSHQK